MLFFESSLFHQKQGYFEASFAWIFAIIVGAIILFLAIFGVSKLIKTEQTISDVEVGKEIGILLNPLETGFESGKTNSLILPVETRIYNGCNNLGSFGRQLLLVSQKSFDRWSDTDINVGFSNKYIFSEDYVEGKTFYLFSKPFDFPFKVADLVYLSSSMKDYCFLRAPDEIERELSALDQKNIFVNNCSTKGIRICFESNSNCDIIVNYDLGYIEKKSSKIYFEGDALMYATIFADKEVYECQLKRLMQRISQLALLYNDKATFVSGVGCHSNLNLLALSNSAKNLDSSLNLGSVGYLEEEIQDKNDLAECKLW